MAKPIFKWAGGKRQLLPQLRPLLPTTWGHYFEPMVGGGALFFDLEPEEASLGDINAHLMLTYQMLRDEVDAVIGWLKRLGAVVNDPESAYYDVRKCFNTRPNDARSLRAARMLYLNRMCFNGLWRENRSGEFNVPYGKKGAIDVVREELLREASEARQSVELVSGSFLRVLFAAKAGDFVYLDPPYMPLKEGAFTSYNGSGFTENDHRGLAEAVQTLVDKGAKVMLSNSDVPFVHGLYRNFPRVRVSARRNINSKGNERGPVSELVVIGGYEVPADVEVLTGSQGA